MVVHITCNAHALFLVVQETNLLSQFPSLGVYIKNGCNLEVKFCHASELTPAIHAWAYELCEQNMHSMYEDVWGWKPAEKQSELKHPDARYLLVHDADRSTVAYVHFRYACLSMWKQCKATDAHVDKPTDCCCGIAAQPQPRTTISNHHNTIASHFPHGPSVVRSYVHSSAVSGHMFEHIWTPYAVSRFCAVLFLCQAAIDLQIRS